MERIKYPMGCITPEDRTAFCYRAQELLRLMHNEVGRWWREGLTSTEYAKLPKLITDKFAYEGKLSDACLKDFRNNVFDPLNDANVEEILKNRELLKKSDNWDTDLNDLKEI